MVVYMGKNKTSLYLLLIRALMLVTGAAAAYTLLTAGSDDSFWRRFFPNPGNDVYIALVSSFAVFVLGFFNFYNRDQETFKTLIEMNAERIRGLRREGKSDQDIAASILDAMGLKKGYKYKMVGKKLGAYLSEFE